MLYMHRKIRPSFIQCFLSKYESILYTHIYWIPIIFKCRYVWLFISCTFLFIYSKMILVMFLEIEKCENSMLTLGWLINCCIRHTLTGSSSSSSFLFKLFMVSFVSSTLHSTLFAASSWTDQIYIFIFRKTSTFKYFA